jgi:hypothetical protein
LGEFSIKNPFGSGLKEQKGFVLVNPNGFRISLADKPTFQLTVSLINNHLINTGRKRLYIHLLVG